MGEVTSERDWLHVARSVPPMPESAWKVIREAAARRGKTAELVLNPRTGRRDLVLKEKRRCP